MPVPVSNEGITGPSHNPIYSYYYQWLWHQSFVFALSGGLKLSGPQIHKNCKASILPQCFFLWEGCPSFSCSWFLDLLSKWGNSAIPKASLWLAGWLAGYLPISGVLRHHLLFCFWLAATFMFPVTTRTGSQSSSLSSPLYISSSNDAKLDFFLISTQFSNL